MPVVQQKDTISKGNRENPRSRENYPIVLRKPRARTASIGTGPSWSRILSGESRDVTCGRGNRPHPQTKPGRISRPRRSNHPGNGPSVGCSPRCTRCPCPEECLPCRRLYLPVVRRHKCGRRSLPGMIPHDLTLPPFCLLTTRIEMSRQLKSESLIRTRQNPPIVSILIGSSSLRQGQYQSGRPHQSW